MTSYDEERLKHHELIVRYFDDALSDDELGELNAMLESSDELRELFNEMVLQSQAIADVESCVQLTNETHAVSTASVHRRIALVGAVSVAVLLFGFFLWPDGETTDSPVVARLETITGVAGPEGDVKVGMTVYSRGAGSAAKLTYRDGTEVVLDNDSRLLVGGASGKSLQLLSGHVTANVTPQPKGKPLRIRTEHALAEVLGTELTLDAGLDSTALSVHEGVVRLQRLSDKQSIDIHAGQFAVADGSDDQELGARHSPVVPDEFSLSFEDRLPSGWRVGKLIKGASEDGNSTVLAAPVSGQPRGTHYQIYTQNAQLDGLPGLFKIHDDTLLNLRYRMKSPGWFQVFVGVRPSNAADSQRANFLFQPSAERAAAGEWRTISVPFSRLRNLQDDSSAEGQQAYFILLDTQTVDRGLELQRFWVTRKGNDAD